MARMGIFNRNDTTPEAVPRSVQDLSRRNTFDTKYMQIVPIFWQQMYPNESIKINVTNFVRSIPMNTPMFSNVRIVTRFVAVPQRIMWSSWEDYIKGDDEFSTSYEEPYIVNSHLPSESSTQVQVFGIHQHGTSRVNNPRCVIRTNKGYISASGEANVPSLESAVAQFGVHELGDYFDAPLYTGLGRSFTNGQKPLRQSAFKYAAYQMAYSYFYRQPNVQTRVDDFAQIGAHGSREFPMFTCAWGSSTDISVQPISTDGHDAFNNLGTVYPTIGGVSMTSLFSRLSTEPNYLSWRTSLVVDSGSTQLRDVSLNGDPSSSNYEQDLLRSSWDKVEHFPLKAGANLSMLAMKPNSVTGLPEYVPSNISLTRMRYANWQTDYFTSENPWQQRGDEQQIPVSGTVNVTLNGVNFTLNSAAVDIPVLNLRAFPAVGSGSSSGVVYLTAEDASHEDGVGLAYSDIYFNKGSIEFTGDNHNVVLQTQTGVGQVSSASGSASSGTATATHSLYVSPSQMKFALAMQHIKEAQAQIDNRYQSYIRKFFGARARDFRLDRPEFIGGCVQDLNVSEVVQQSASTDDSPMGTLAGRGVSSKTSKSIRYHAEEHTLILGLMHIIPDTEYIHGLDKEDNTQDRFDWMLPQLGHLPEQAVYNYELSVSNFGLFGNPYEVHGYEPIYNNLRWKKNSAHGAFRDWLNSRGSYEYYKPWLITRDFGYDSYNVPDGGAYFRSRVPTLSDSFLSGRYGVDNSNFVVTDSDVMYPFMVDSYFKVRMVRTIPTRGTVSKI